MSMLYALQPPSYQPVWFCRVLAGRRGGCGACGRQCHRLHEVQQGGEAEPHQHGNERCAEPPYSGSEPHEPFCCIWRTGSPRNIAKSGLLDYKDRLHSLKAFCGRGVMARRFAICLRICHCPVPGCKQSSSPTEEHALSIIHRNLLSRVLDVRRAHATRGSHETCSRRSWQRSDAS